MPFGCMWTLCSKKSDILFFLHNSTFFENYRSLLFPYTSLKGGGLILRIFWDVYFGITPEHISSPNRTPSLNDINLFVFIVITIQLKLRINLVHGLTFFMGRFTSMSLNEHLNRPPLSSNYL